MDPVDEKPAEEVKAEENLQSEFSDLIENKSEAPPEEPKEEPKEVPVKEEVDYKALAEEAQKNYKEISDKFTALEKTIAKPTEANGEVKEEVKAAEPTFAVPKFDNKPLEENIDFDINDLHAILSGEKEKALPVIRKAAAAIRQYMYDDMMIRDNQRQQVERYGEQIKEHFYTNNKDLIGKEKFVKIVYDDFCKANPNIMPHLFLKEVAEHTRKMLKDLGIKNEEIVITPKAPARRVVTVKGGEGGDVRPVEPGNTKMTEQEKEMFDMIEDHDKKSKQLFTH